MKTFSRQIKVMITLVTSVVCLMALKAPGYDENGQDINECLEAPCPEGYTMFEPTPLVAIFVKLPMVKLSEEV